MILFLLPTLDVGVLAESWCSHCSDIYLRGGFLNCLKGGRATVKGRLVINRNFRNGETEIWKERTQVNKLGLPSANVSGSGNQIVYTMEDFQQLTYN